MVNAKLLSAALFTVAVIATPAMARDRHVTSPRATEDVDVNSDPGAAYAAAPDASLGYRAYGYRCVPAPRVGQFASQPWDKDVPCQPGAGMAY